MKNKSLLSQYSIRKTRPRLQIISVIGKFKNRHFSVEEVLKGLRRGKSKVSRASAYRAINLFSQKGLLRPIDLGKGFLLYERASQKSHHDHLYCINCGKIIEFKDQSIEKLQMKVCRKKRFHPKSHTLRITGLCKECL
ncbi:MAG: transcriptional repressor [Candidatus Omnitrophica bacterium]|nr:transcriptional repressor [Candidatus Omnitrophota bacterium]